MSVLRLSLAIPLAFVAGCGLFGSGRNPQELAAEFGGDVAGYEQLAAETDCVRLDHEVTRGQNNYEDTGERPWVGWYHAASQRYDELDCDAELYPSD
jgi:hypothetical protein